MIRDVLFIGVSVLAAGCATASPSGYAGTGSLAVSGATTQPLLASHAVRFGSCMEPGYPNAYEPAMRFSVVSIGDVCVMYGTGGPSDFHADPDTVCTLTFPDGPHPILVTDFMARYGARVSRRTYVDTNYIEVGLGGDDAATRTHVLYTFAGSASTDAPWPTSCDAERANRARLVTQSPTQASKGP